MLSAIKFADGYEFISKSIPLLTSSVPVGLIFRTNPGRIVVQGDGQGRRKTSNLIDTTTGLHVQGNQTLGLVGGDLVFSGATLKTAGGRIELGSVAEESSVNLIPADKGWELDYSGVSSFRDIQLSEATAVDASGIRGGDIQVQARNLTLLSGAQIEAATLAGKEGERGGTLIINTSGSVSLVGILGSGLFSNTNISSEVYEAGNALGGNLQIKTGRLHLCDEATIAAGTAGMGDAGSIEILSSEVEVIGKSVPSNTPLGSSISSVVEPGGTGNGGKINIHTGRLTVRDGGVISSGTFGQGEGGSLDIKASEFVEVTGKLYQFEKRMRQMINYSKGDFQGKSWQV